MGGKDVEPERMSLEFRGYRDWGNSLYSSINLFLRVLPCTCQVLEHTLVSHSHLKIQPEFITSLQTSQAPLWSHLCVSQGSVAGELESLVLLQPLCQYTADHPSSPPLWPSPSGLVRLSASGYNSLITWHLASALVLINPSPLAVKE